MRKWKKTVLFMILTVLLTGCSHLKPGVEDYTMPEKTDAVQKEAESIIDRLAKQKHVAPELSDDFVSKYLDLNSFEELKRRTKAGIAATNATADMTEKEFRLWSDIIATKRLNQYTVDDLNAKKEELYHILSTMATEQQTSLEEMMDVDYGMKMEELNAFIQSQAEKYLHDKKTEDNQAIP